MNLETKTAPIQKCKPRGHPMPGILVASKTFCDFCRTLENDHMPGWAWSAKSPLLHVQKSSVLANNSLARFNVPPVQMKTSKPAKVTQIILYCQLKLQLEKLYTQIVSGLQPAMSIERQRTNHSRRTSVRGWGRASNIFARALDESHVAIWAGLMNFKQKWTLNINKNT